MMKFILKLITRWNQFLTIPIGLLIWKYTPWLMHISGYDESVGQYDSSVLMKIPFSILAVSLLSGVAWLFFRVTFPKAYKYLENVFGDNLEGDNLTTWQKSKIVLSLLFFYLGILVLTLNAI